MLCTNQLQNRLVNDYNLPMLIQEEINYCEEKLVDLSSSTSRKSTWTLFQDSRSS